MIFLALEQVKILLLLCLDIKSEVDRRPKDCKVDETRWYIPSCFALLRGKDDGSADRLISSEGPIEVGCGGVYG